MTFTLDPNNLMLRLPQSERAAAWKGHRYTVAGAGFRKLDKAEQRERTRLERERQREKAERNAERLRYLREHY